MQEVHVSKEPGSLRRGIRVSGRREAVMAFISRGFRGRRTPDVDPGRVPPGQYVTADFPVLSAGPTPHTALES